MSPGGCASVSEIVVDMVGFLTSLKSSHILVFLIVYLSFLLDNMLLTVVGKYDIIVNCIVPPPE